ncbi:MAG TPA: hypothetical protein VIW68_07005 [Candidatus Sulfotelmatobacter sp.]
MRRCALCLATILILSCVLFAAPAPAGGSSVVKKIPVAGQGSFDYLSVDEAGRRLYVSHGTRERTSFFSPR